MKSDGHFKYVYMALRAFIRGFLNCIRLVVVVDATHCKGKYKGIILVVASIDINKQIYYPVICNINHPLTTKQP